MAFSADSNSSAQTFIEPPPWWTSDWDTGRFDTVVVPGFTHIEVDRGPKWDRKPVKGQTGETQTFGGWNNADLKIKIRTWTAAQHEAVLATIVPILEPDPGKDAPKEIGIEHPVAAARKIESFRVQKLKGPTPNFKDGYTEWEIDAFQSIKKAPAPAGPPGKPGQTPCQKWKADFEFQTQRSATLNALIGQITIRIASGLQADGVTPLAGSDYETLTAQLKQATADLRVADDSALHAAIVLQDNGCNEQSPSSQAAAGDTLAP